MTDPLDKTGPPSEIDLFKKMAALGAGVPHDLVINAAMNVVLNALRQSQDTRAKAEMAFDAIAGRAKAVLLDQHYDGLGKRRGVFPFDQRIDVPAMDFRRPDRR